MQRYFFHMASKNQVVKDEIGREMDSLSAAHVHAVDLARKATKYLMPEDTKGWTLQVANSTGRVQLIVPIPVQLIHEQRSPYSCLHRRKCTIDRIGSSVLLTTPSQR
jgi:hypothetical protein